MGAQHHAISMQQNTIRRRHRGRMSKDNRASAGERWSASLGMPVWPSRPAVPGIACRMFNIRDQKATNRIDTLPLAISAFRRASGAWNGCDTTATASPLLSPHDGVNSRNWSHRSARSPRHALGKKEPPRTSGGSGSQMRTLKFSTSGLHCCQLLEEPAARTAS